MKHNHLSKLKVENTYAFQVSKGRIPTWDQIARNKKYRRAILTRDNHRCIFCGCQIVEGENHSFDHILPQSQVEFADNRHNSEYNIVSCCRLCNQKKSAKTVYDFMIDNGYEMSDIIRVQSKLDEIMAHGLKVTK